jgi:hypothetical protein
VIVVPFVPSSVADACGSVPHVSCRTAGLVRHHAELAGVRERGRGDDLGGEQRLAVMAVDFQPVEPTCVAAQCWRQHELRAPQPLHGMRDAEDRRSITEALLRLGRPGSCPKRPRAGRGW